MTKTIQPAPVRRSVTVNSSPARAFQVFTARMGDWWPRGKTVAASPHQSIVIEPRKGGRWFERAEDGTESEWGVVLAWSPPDRLLLGWQLTAAFKFDPDFLTEVEVTFEARDDGVTCVTLEHRNLERFGDAAEKTRASLDGGWPSFLKVFADFIDADGD